jgi:hypothetical protein
MATCLFRSSLAFRLQTFLATRRALVATMSVPKKPSFTWIAF